MLNAMHLLLSAVALALCISPGSARMMTMSSANPVRRVVNMLQAMQSKVAAEGKEEQDLFDKFMCYCKTGSESLAAGIEAAKTKIPQLESDIQKLTAEKAQLGPEIEQAKNDRKAALKSMKDATSLREKEANSFQKESTDLQNNINAMGKAIDAIQKGLASSFLQTGAAASLALLVKSAEMSEGDRDAVSSFLSGGQEGSESSPGSLEIVGILKQLKETSEADLKEMKANEKSANEDYESLWAAKRRQIDALITAAETKTARLGEVSTNLVNMVEDLDETKKGLGEDTKFLQDLGKSCATKKDEWDSRSKTRSDELLALADTIKVLNDDDALDLFKKALPSTSFLQIQLSSKDVLQQARHALDADSRRDPQLDFISLAMRSKKANFDQLLGMIDKLVSHLGKEQFGDDSKKAYCGKELDVSEDKKKEMEHTQAQLGTVISETQSAMDGLKEDISNLAANIKDLDKQVVEATEMRKQEHKEYSKERAANTGAKQILSKAKDRMREFYRPQSPASFVQVSSHREDEFGVPPPPPETYGAYSKKGAESTSVVSMMEWLIGDLVKQMAAADTEEKDSQASYEKFVADSAQKRSTDSLALESKEAAKAQSEGSMFKSKASLKVVNRKLKVNAEYIANLHKECDWLIANYDIRRKARADEVDSLDQAKAVLSGADYS